jgi:hypothetical protein
MGDLPGIELQPRDWSLLRGLFESRVMTLAHASALYFDGRKEMAKKRVQRLKAAGIIRERPRHFSSPSVLFLPRRAFELLHATGRLSDCPRIGLADLERRGRVSDLTLRHELEVMDVKVAMTTAVNRTEQFRIAEFSTWPKLHEFKATRSDGERVTVKPDGFVRIHESEADGATSEHVFFLEVDRFHEALGILCHKAHCYLDYYRHGGFAVRNGGTKDDYREFPFRVLAICKSDERKQNLAQSLLRNTPPIRHQWCLATMADAIQDPIGEIWTSPADYPAQLTTEKCIPHGLTALS